MLYFYSILYRLSCNETKLIQEINNIAKLNQLELSIARLVPCRAQFWAVEGFSLNQFDRKEEKGVRKMPCKKQLFSDEGPILGGTERRI